MAARRSRNLIGLLVCAVLAAVAPPAGAALSTLLVRRAFEDVESIEPSRKAAVLAERISEAMNGTAAGMLVSLVMVAGAVVFAVRLSRERRARG